MSVNAKVYDEVKTTIDQNFEIDVMYHEDYFKYGRTPVVIISIVCMYFIVIINFIASEVVRSSDTLLADLKSVLFPLLLITQLSFGVIFILNCVTLNIFFNENKLVRNNPILKLFIMGTFVPCIVIFGISLKSIYV